VAQEAISFLFVLLIERGENGCNTSKGLKAGLRDQLNWGGRGEERILNKYSEPAACTSHEGGMRLLPVFAVLALLRSFLIASHCVSPFAFGSLN
jgi:hypothetical protein